MECGTKSEERERSNEDTPKASLLLFFLLTSLCAVSTVWKRATVLYFAAPYTVISFLLSGVGFLLSTRRWPRLRQAGCTAKSWEYSCQHQMVRTLWWQSVWMADSPVLQGTTTRHRNKASNAKAEVFIVRWDDSGKIWSTLRTMKFSLNILFYMLLVFLPLPLIF